jgi:hypothetical protein
MFMFILIVTVGVLLYQPVMFNVGVKNALYAKSFASNCVFVFTGYHVIHSVANIIIVYLILVVYAGTKLSVVLVFVANMV